MSYYADLTPYNYRHHSKKELNIGWLQKDNDFTKGEVPVGFLEKLKAYNERPHTVHHTKGWHGCDFCEEKSFSMAGSCEMRIISQEGIVYACPELIIHYIESHNYLPPQEFIDAVILGPTPGSDAYNDVIKFLPESWERRKEDENDEDYHEKIKQAMIESLSSEIDAKIMKNILEQSPEFSKFVKDYGKIMPEVYKVNLNDKKNKDKS